MGLRSNPFHCRWREGGGEKLHKPTECRGEPALTPFKVRLIGNGLGEDSLDQDRHHEPRIRDDIRSKFSGGDSIAEVCDYVRTPLGASQKLSRPGDVRIGKRLPR